MLGTNLDRNTCRHTTLPVATKLSSPQEDSNKASFYSMNIFQLTSLSGFSQSHSQIRSRVISNFSAKPTGYIKNVLDRLAASTGQSDTDTDTSNVTLSPIDNLSQTFVSVISPLKFKDQ